MKKILIILLFFIPHHIIASDSITVKPFIIKADILLPFVGMAADQTTVFDFTFEYCFKNRQSIQLTGLYDYHYDWGNHDKVIQIIPQYKFSFSNKKPNNGFFTGAYIKFIYVDYSWYRENEFGGGILLGYQSHIGKRFILEALLGIGERERTYIKSYPQQDVNFIDENAQPDGVAAINIGYKF